MSLKVLFGKKLKEIRESKNLTQSELAELCDMQTNSIALIENGQRAASFETVEILAEKLQVDYYELFYFVSENSDHKNHLLSELNRKLNTFNEKLLKHMVDYANLILTLTKSDEQN